MNAPDSLITFCKLLEQDKALQLKVKEAKHPKQIIEFAASCGCIVSSRELRLWSKELTAPYFPWSQMGNEWRRKFFE